MQAQLAIRDTSEADMDGIKDWLDRLSAMGFFGRAEITFQRGKPVHVRQESSFKPHQLRTSGNPIDFDHNLTSRGA